MSKVKTLTLLHLVIICLCTSLLFTSCKYQASDEQRIEIVSSIAEIVNENYRNENAEKPLYISMNEIDNLADTESDLHKAFEKYEDVKGYDVYLVDRGKSYEKKGDRRVKNSALWYPHKEEFFA